MSERLTPRQPEQLPAPEQAAETQADRLRQLQEAAKTAEAIHSGQEVTALQKAAETQAISGKELPVGNTENSTDQTSGFGLQQDLKNDAYKRTLKKTQARLSAPARSFSRLAHQPAVEGVSNAAAKTIGRPSGVLGGSICALIGSAYLLYMTKHYGFSYNYLAFFVFLAGGFALGALIELGVHAVRRR